MAFRWLPNIADFFSLARLIEDSERQPNSASYDSIEFLVRRLDEHKRALATLTSRSFNVQDHSRCLAELSFVRLRIQQPNHDQKIAAELMNLVLAGEVLESTGSIPALWHPSLRGRKGVSRVKHDRVFLFSVIRYYEKILSVNCE